jgi:hypothetical protein
MGRLTVLAVFVAFLSGCRATTKLSPEELSSHDFGAAPIAYHSSICGYLNKPASAVQCEPPVQGKVWKGLFRGGDEYGWIVFTKTDSGDYDFVFRGEVILDSINFWSAHGALVQAGNPRDITAVAER